MLLKMVIVIVPFPLKRVRETGKRIICDPHLISVLSVRAASIVHFFILPSGVYFLQLLIWASLD